MTLAKELKRKVKALSWQYCWWQPSADKEPHNINEAICKLSLVKVEASWANTSNLHTSTEAFRIISKPPPTKQNNQGIQWQMVCSVASLRTLTGSLGDSQTGKHFVTSSGVDRQCLRSAWVKASAAGSVRNSSAAFSCAQIIILSQRNLFWLYLSAAECPLKVSLHTECFFTCKLSWLQISQNPHPSWLVYHHCWSVGWYDLFGALDFMDWDGTQADTMTASHPNVNSPGPAESRLLPVDQGFLSCTSEWGWCDSSESGSCFFALQSKVNGLPGLCPQFNFLPIAKQTQDRAAGKEKWKSMATLERIWRKK